MSILKKHPLTALVILGFMLRLLFLFTSDHLFYPDELYQSLEQSFRLVQGYSIIPWDFIYGIRSYVLPGLLAIPLKLAFLLHLTDPAIYRYFIQIPLILASLTIIMAGYRLVYFVTKKQASALFVAFCLAVWYELIYFSARALTEISAVYCFSLAVIFLACPKKREIIGAFFLAAGCLFRPHFFPLAIIAGLAFYRPKEYLKAAVGIVLAICLFGLSDVYSIGTFLSSLKNNLMLNFIAKVSEHFGTQYWWTYLAFFAITSAGIFLLSLWPPKSVKARLLWLSLVSVVGLHMLIPHKEYRFLFVCIPLWLCLLAINVNGWINRKKIASQLWLIAAAAMVIISGLGFANKLPYQSYIYEKPLFLKDPDIVVYERLFHDQTLCSLYDVSRDWVYTPGYFYLNRNVPIYSLDYQPPNLEMISHFIIPKTDQEFPGMTRLMDTPGYWVYSQSKPTWITGYTVFKNDRTTCAVDPQYSRLRYFQEIQTVLQSVGAKPVIH